MGSIGCVRCEKFAHDFRARTFALIALVRPVLKLVLLGNKWSQMHPTSTKRIKICVYGPMGWIGCVRCERFRCDFAARTFALIAPVQLVLYRALCSNETIQNASQQYETHQNMSLGPNGVDREHSLQKILMQLCGTNFCTNCTSSARFVSRFVQ